MDGPKKTCLAKCLDPASNVTVYDLYLYFMGI